MPDTCSWTIVILVGYGLKNFNSVKFKIDDPPP